MTRALISLLILICLAPRVSRSTTVEQDVLSRQDNVELKGIHKPVDLHYNGRGVPFIEAQDEEDLYFAQGYIVARDRLWQMDLIRRTCRGQLAEIFGATALDEDKLHRTYGFAELADRILANLDPSATTAVNAYARGVNEYIQTLNDQTLPIEFRLLKYKPSPWQPSDCVILGKMFAEALSDSWRFDLVRAAFAGAPKKKYEQLFQTKSAMDVLLLGHDQRSALDSDSTSSLEGKPELAGQALEASLKTLPSEKYWLEKTGFAATLLAASNNWVVSGVHSRTGKPLLANDPHLDPSAPSIWYMISLESPGFHCEGVTVPGAPGVFIGHNDRVAWGITNVEADVEDLFLEKFDPAKPGQYLTPDGWREAEVRHYEIGVRDKPAERETHKVALDVTVTRHGPIILDTAGKRYALKWSALDPSTNELGIYYYLDRAQSCRDFEKKLAGYTGFPLNFVYADTGGNIGWSAQGRYPIRKTGRGDVPNQGETNAGEWMGYIPSSATPHIYDPLSGIIVTANSRTVGDSYKYYLGDLWAEPYRARRIYELLTARRKLTVDDFERIQADTYSVAGAILAGEVIKMATPRASSSREWAAILEEFKHWDFKATPDSRAMLVVAMMRHNFANRILVSAFGKALANKYGWTSSIFFDMVIERQPGEWLPKEYKSYPDLILDCYHQTLSDIKRQLGPDESKWKWGEFMKVSFPHALSDAPFIGSRFNIPAFPMNGSALTINNGSNVSMRFIADLSDWDNSRMGIPLGESGDPSSPHWSDQLSDWRNVTPGPFPFTRKAVGTASVGEVLLKPAP